MARANSVIENGRLAIQLLESDLVHAGFWGAFVPQFDDQTGGVIPADAPTAVPDPCAGYRPGPAGPRRIMTNLLGIPVQVYDSDCDMRRRSSTDKVAEHRRARGAPRRDLHSRAKAAIARRTIRTRSTSSRRNAATELVSGVPTPYVPSDEPGLISPVYKQARLRDAR